MSIKKFYPNASISLEVAPFCDGLCKITASIEEDGRVSKLDILSELTPAAVDAGNQRAVAQLLALLGAGVETSAIPETEPSEVSTTEANPSEASTVEAKPKLVKHRTKKSQPKEEPVEETQAPQPEPVPVEETAETAPAVEVESPEETIPAPSEQDTVEETAAVEPAAESVAEPAEDAISHAETVASEEDDSADAGEPGETVPEEVAEEPEEDIETKREWAKTVLVEIEKGARVSGGMKSFVGKPVWDMVREKRSFGPLILSRAKAGAHILTPDAEEALRIIVDMLKE